jgi:hypothetical protein
MGLFSKRRENKGSRAIEQETGIDDLLDLQAPPFGLGFQRRATEMVTGSTPGGHRYRSFNYAYEGGLYRFKGRVLVIDLPFALPEVFWTTGSRTRAGMEDAGRLGCLQYESLRVCSVDEKVAQQVFEAVMAPTKELALILNEPVDVSVDHNHLVAVGVPTSDGLPQLLSGLDQMITALAGTVPRRMQLPDPVARYSFFGHPDWNYEPIGDRSLLRDFSLPVRPQGRIEDLLTCEGDGVKMVAFRYTWLSDVAVNSKMSRGMVLETDREQEPVCAFVLDSKLPDLSINGESLGEPVNLGNREFAEAFDLRSTDPQQTYQLFNERVQDWILNVRPYGWTVRGNIIRFEVPTHDALVVAECETILHGWLDRMPREVRRSMGLPEMPSLAH